MIQVVACAKLNLFLHILRRRADSYHELQSVFARVNLCDTLQITQSADCEIHSTLEADDVSLPPLIGSSDLCYRAAQAFRVALNKQSRLDIGGDISTPAWERGVTIKVTKRIPIGAGMGGGSSDAATTLLTLNELWGAHFTQEQLVQIGLTLGADVPFFVAQHNAWVEGIGEQLTPINLPPMDVVIVFPRVHVATVNIFQAADLPRATPAINWPATLNRIELIDLMATTHNDLEAVACRQHPELRAVRTWLQQNSPYPQTVRMTGSGSAFFTLVPDRQTALELVQRCQKTHSDWWSRACALVA